MSTIMLDKVNDANTSETITTNAQDILFAEAVVGESNERMAITPTNGNVEEQVEANESIDTEENVENVAGDEVIDLDQEGSVEGELGGSVEGELGGSVEGEFGKDMLGGNVDGMYGEPYMETSAPAVKDPLLSSWTFVIGISSAVLVVSIFIGGMLARRKIKKGIELYED